MKKSLQAIEDYYYQKGLRSSKLRRATEADEEYIKILQKRWAQLTKKFFITSQDKKRYSMSTDADYQILDRIYRLEKRKLSPKDRELVKLVRTQLEHHWRAPILRFLNQLVKKYRV
ncbi:MAG: hypothetical protein WC480_04720 [Patescibacteria group bacterium]